MGFAEKLPDPDEESGYPWACDNYDHVVPVSYPSSPGAVVYVYFDGDHFRRQTDIDAVMADYQNRYPKTDFQPAVITRKDLPNRRYFVFPRTEREFISRRYAAEFDHRKGNEGPVTTAYLSAQKSILHVQASLLARILSVVGPTFFDGENRPADALDREAHIADSTLSVLAPLFGEDSVKQGQTNTSYALVDWQGLRLGRDEVSWRDHAHLAFSGTPNSWFKGARAAIGAGFFGRHPADGIARQIALELSEAGLVAFFGAGHWCRRDVPVSAGAVLTWQSQVIGSLRKLLWRGEAEEGQPLLRNQLMIERQALHAGRIYRNPVGSGRLPAGDPETTFRDIFAEQINDFADRFAARSAGKKQRILGENVSTSVDERDILIGALYGSGIDLRMPDEKPDPVLELAWWLARLRQTGEGVIGDYFAYLLEEVQRDPRTELTDLLYAAMSHDVWLGLLQGAAEVERTDQTITVRYTWGNLAEPWAAIRQDGDLTISGPLLYFPVTEAAKWAQLSELLASNEEFLAPWPTEKPTD